MMRVLGQKKTDATSKYEKVKTFENRLKCRIS